MGSKINLKARIKRHSRVLKHGFSWKNNTNKSSRFGYMTVIFITVFLLPIYPTFASLVHNNTVLEFYRWDIDESSIISSYFWWDNILWEWDLIAESKDSYLSINTLLDDRRDLSWTNEIIDYEVKSWDNISKIAYKFRVSTNSIYWANNFSKNKIIHPWDKIKIPPVSGLIHQVKSGETISVIAKKYKVEEKKIIDQNLLTTFWTLKEWDVLVIPWAIKQVVKPVKKVYKNYNNKPTTKDTWYYFANSWKSQYLDWNEKWIYKLKRRKPQHTFYRWNCTWYVAQYKNVNWWWNAKDWFRNAQNKWHKTWSNPWVWSIVVLHWRWYNPRYGHVAIVIDIKKDYIYVSDMNYRRLWEITYRKIPKNDRSILWYIYVD